MTAINETLIDLIELWNIMKMIRNNYKPLCHP